MLTFTAVGGCTDESACNYGLEQECTYPTTGDINQDCTFDVLDVVETVEVVLQETQQTEEQILLSDINNDGVVDVIDIVMLVGIVLGRLMMRF